MPEVDLIYLILVQIFKINESLLTKYYTVTDQLLYLLLIPNLVIIVFIFGFAGFLSNMSGKEHKGLRNLIAISTYIVIVWTGWYGSIIAPLSITWFLIMIGFGLFLFFITKIFPPKMAKDITDTTSQAILNKREEKAKQEQIRKDLRTIVMTINDLKAQMHGGPADKGTQAQINALLVQKRQLESQLK